MRYQTQVASLKNYKRGKLDLFADDPKHYAFSNIFDVANRSNPFERVAVTKNMEYVTEVIKTEGVSSWFTAAHDEFALVMDGEIEFSFQKLAHGETLPSDKLGSVQLNVAPSGKPMGWIRARRGHLVLLPVGSAYRLSSKEQGVALLQTMAGELTRERWADICVLS